MTVLPSAFTQIATLQFLSKKNRRFHHESSVAHPIRLRRRPTMVPPLPGDPPLPGEPPAAAGDLLPPTTVEAPSCSLITLAGGQTASDLGLASPGRRLDDTRNNAFAHMTTVGLLLLVCLVFRLVHDIDVLFCAQPTLEVLGVLRVGSDAAGEDDQGGDGQVPDVQVDQSLQIDVVAHARSLLST